MPVARGPRPLLDQDSWIESRLIRRPRGRNQYPIERVFESQALTGRNPDSFRSYTRNGMRKRFRFRPPGLKPTTKVGTLGPYRGRLGFAWVIAPIFAGIAILLAGWLLLR